MARTLKLPDELARRLAVEAERRGQDIEEVAAELLAAGLPPEAPEPSGRRRLSFAGVGAGGGEAVGRNHEEILRRAFAAKTARDA